jgi:hypothetical protein
MKSGTIVILVVVAIVVWFLLNKTQSTVTGINRSIKQTYSAAGTAEAVVTNAAPALGSFLSNLAKGFGSTSGSASSSDASFSNGAWGSSSAIGVDSQFADYDLV